MSSTTGSTTGSSKNSSTGSTTAARSITEATSASIACGSGGGGGAPICCGAPCCCGTPCCCGVPCGGAQVGAVAEAVDTFKYSVDMHQCSAHLVHKMNHNELWLNIYELKTRMVANLQEAPSRSVDLLEIKKRCECESSTHFLGKIIKKIFPKVTCKRARNTENWSKQTTRYDGICWKEISNANKEILFNNITDLVQLPFFTMNISETEITLGLLSNDTINGNKGLLELKLNRNQSWSLVVFGQEVILEKLRISNKYEMTRAGIRNVLDTVKTIQFCKGAMSESCLEKENFFREEISDQGKAVYVRYRHAKCFRVLPFGTRSVTCPKCNEFSSSKPDEEEGEDKEEVTLDQQDHEDLKEILNRIMPECPENIVTFLQSQHDALKRNPKGRRWNKNVIRICLTLWCRSPRGYQDLRGSGFIVLPSERLLRYYKNSINQVPGINKDILYWMANAAKDKNVPTTGYEGGLLLDEMSIQEDLQMSRIGEDIKLVGFCDTCEESLDLKVLMTRKKDVQLASHVLQFVFLGFSGFRFPFAHFPTKQASASDLYLLFWKAVRLLLAFGFIVRYVSMDGAQTNRDFMSICMKDQAKNLTYSIKNVFQPKGPCITFIMDYSHVLKRIRNNISKSGEGKNHKRKLMYKGKFIFWDHWIKAYFWDINSNPFPIHHKLTQEHLFLNNESKMRNKLAEEVLNVDMLNLMECYKTSQTDATHLDASIELLHNTSKLVANFRDARPITQLADSRLQENHEALNWFQQWEDSIKKHESLSKGEKEKALMSYQTRDDIASTILGFEEVCKQKLSAHDGSSLIPSRVNSDVIENVFCQQRGLHNGANSNPTYLSYCRTINTIILGQATISRKSNTGGSSAEPVQFSNNCKRKPLQLLNNTKAKYSKN